MVICWYRARVTVEDCFAVRGAEVFAAHHDDFELVGVKLGLGKVAGLAHLRGEAVQIPSKHRQGGGKEVAQLGMC